MPPKEDNLRREDKKAVPIASSLRRFYCTCTCRTLQWKSFVSRRWIWHISDSRHRSYRKRSMICLTQACTKVSKGFSLPSSLPPPPLSLSLSLPLPHPHPHPLSLPLSHCETLVVWVFRNLIINFVFNPADLPSLQPFSISNSEHQHLRRVFSLHFALHMVLAACSGGVQGCGSYYRHNRDPTLPSLLEEVVSASN